MAVPKKKTSKSRRNMRRSHHSLEKVNLATDSVTGEYRLSHNVNTKDGMYKGKKVIKTKMDKIKSKED